MKKVTNNILKGMASRFSATVMLLAMGCIAAFAQGYNKLYIEDFKIAPGTTQTVEIKMSNEDLVSSLQFDLDINNSSLEFVDGSLACDGKRITSKSHTVLIKQMGSDEGTYKILVLSESATMKDSYIKYNDESETILTFKVKAKNNFKEGKIGISGVIGSDGTVEDTKDVVFDDKVPMAKASAYVGAANIEMDSPNVRRKLFQVPVSLDNIVEVAGFQAKVTLPEGVFITEDENEEQVVLNPDRVSGNVKYSIPEIPNEPGSYTLLISALTGELFSGNSGNLFTLNLNANKDFNEGEIVISDIVISTRYGYSYEIDPVSVAVKVVTDPSGDGVWDIDDVESVIDFYLIGEFDAVNDLNGDGFVDIDDVEIAIDNYLNN